MITVAHIVVLASVALVADEAQLTVVTSATDATVHAVVASGEVDVHVVFDKLGKKHTVSASGVTVSVAGDVLTVNAPAHTDGEGPSVTITTDALVSVSAAGGARVDASGVAGKSLALSATGASTIRVDGKINDVAVATSGTAHIDASALSAASATVTMKDASRAELKVSSSLTCDLKRASRLTVKGKPTTVRKTVDGVAKLVLE